MKFLNFTYAHVSVNIQKFRTFFHFLFSKKVWVIRAKIHKMLVKIANREDPDQTASFVNSSPDNPDK